MAAAARLAHAGPYETVFVGEDDGLDAVAQRELSEQAGDVRLDRGWLDDELGGDLRVRESAGEQAQDVKLAAGEQAKRGRRRGGAREFLDQPACAPGREERVAFVHGAYAGDELVPRRRLEEKSGGAGAECIDYVLVEIEGGQDQHAQGGAVGKQASGRLDPAQLRHADVHEHDVRAELACPLERLLAVTRLTDALDVGLCAVATPEARSDERLVVGEQDSDHASAPPSGRRALTV